MRAWTDRLATLGTVTTFDYPYMREGRRRPDAHGVLLEAHRAALADVRREGSGPIVLAGKSMGSRIGCHLALDETDVHALVCFGYPLVSPGKKKALRDQVLVDLRAPILFIQGTRDRLCPLDELARVRERMTAASELHVVEAGDHSLAVTKKQSQEAADAGILAAIRSFLSRAE
jgi:hypothetical protein